MSKKHEVQITNKQFAQLVHNTFDYWRSTIAQFERFEIAFYRSHIDDDKSLEVSASCERVYLITSIYLSLKALETLVEIIEKNKENEILNRIEGIDEFKKIDQNMRENVDYKKIHSLRNYTQHPIEYLLNIGNDQKKLDIEKSKDLNFRATWIIGINHSDIYIFGIHIPTLIEKFRENFPVVEFWCNQIKYTCDSKPFVLNLPKKYTNL